MELKAFVIAATQIGIIEAREEAIGWSICFKDRVSSSYISCANRGGSRRSWKNADTLIKQLRKTGYRGKIIIPITAEQMLFA